MAKRQVYWVSPNQQNRWAVKKQDGKKPIQTFEKKSDAIARAKELAKSQTLGQVKIQKRDGSIQTEYTYGKDPYPPKG